MVYVAGVPTQTAAGTMAAVWGERSNIIAQHEISQIVWNGTPIHRSIWAKSGYQGSVGSAQVGNKKVDLILQSPITQPSFIWRITHPLEMIKGVPARPTPIT